MLYDQHGRKIDIEKITSPLAGRSVYSETSDRLESDVSRSLTPTKIDQILMTANSGETADQCRLSVELEEKNWDIAHALLTRRNAVLGIGWDIEPGGENAADKKAAEDFKAVLEGTGIGGTDTFENLLDDMMSALLPGFSASEIVWLPGGKGIAGFSFIDQRHFTFRDGFSPKLVTSNNSEGIEFPPYKAILHKYRRRGGDPARGGLIRPLAWLHCFSSIDFKDLVRFMERYGMPFAVAKVDDESWNNERTAIKSLIRNFGPDGGGVFTRAVEIELLQAANNTGDIYFKLLEYLGAAITKVILGQTATAGDGGGWSNDGAQDAVRQDILEADCDLLAGTINSQLIPPWSAWNLSESTAKPYLKFACEPPEDQKLVHEVMEAKMRAMGTAVRGGFLTPTADDEKAIREYFELPELPAAALAAWKQEDGARRPITLQSAAQAAAEVEETENDTKTKQAPAKKDSAALSAEDSEESYSPEQEKLFAQFADYMGKYLDDPDGLDELALALAEDPEELFASFADDLEKYLEKDLTATIKLAKKEVADARSI